MTITTSEIDGYTLVNVAGEIDLYTAPRLKEAVSGLIEEGTHNLVIDLTRVEFLDSSGLGVLVGAGKAINARNGSLQLVANQDRVLRAVPADWSHQGVCHTRHRGGSISRSLTKVDGATPGGRPAPGAATPHRRYASPMTATRLRLETHSHAAESANAAQPSSKVPGPAAGPDRQ